MEAPPRPRPPPAVLPLASEATGGTGPVWVSPPARRGKTADSPTAMSLRRRTRPSRPLPTTPFAAYRPRHHPRSNGRLPSDEDPATFTEPIGEFVEALVAEFEGDETVKAAAVALEDAKEKWIRARGWSDEHEDAVRRYDAAACHETTSSRTPKRVR